ncbi:Actin- protein 3 [Cichlidogyrus casuarinus]|uniref:Actin- protein 3 n=1 Tax=Cichlidogyrus casuarinus TaxID=1844966 RepID=A0ABD2PUV0_9PLAT
MGIKLSKQRHKPRITKTQIPWLIRGAIRSNNVETMQYLLTYPNHVDPSMVIGGVCPLNLAVELGHLQMVKILIKAGADVHVADAPRYPLHQVTFLSLLLYFYSQAAIYGWPDVAELLIKSGASINAMTATRQTCLHLLAHQTSRRFQETAKIFLRYGANPNELDDDGMAPLHLASVEMIRVLATHELTDLNFLSKNGDSPLVVMAKDRKETNLHALLSFAEQPLPLETAAKEKQKPLELPRQSSAENGYLIPSELSDVEIACDEVSERKRRTSIRPKRSNSGKMGGVFHVPGTQNNHRRTASSKSTVSVTSRMTLISSSTSGKKAPGVVVGRANSAASVNLHSIKHLYKHNQVRGPSGFLHNLFSSGHYPSSSSCTKKLDAAFEFISPHKKSDFERNSSSVSTLSGALKVSFATFSSQLPHSINSVPD